MSEPVNVFTINYATQPPSLAVFYNRYGGHSSLIDVACTMVENPDEGFKLYEEQIEPVTFAIGEILIDRGQQKAWMWSGEITCEFEFWKREGETNNDMCALRRHDRVPRLWTFYVCRTAASFRKVITEADLMKTLKRT